MTVLHPHKHITIISITITNYNTKKEKTEQKSTAANRLAPEQAIRLLGYGHELSRDKQSHEYPL
jgi:hypothetical protein